MEKFLLDTSCMVAAVSGWHEHHDEAAREISRRMAHGDKLVSAAPALIEAYAVLTRLPSPQRLSPTDALAIIEMSFVANTEVVAVENQSYVALLKKAPRIDVYGGRIYDAVIAECAVQSRVSALLTFNPGHFKKWESDRLRIVVPGAKKV